MSLFADVAGDSAFDERIAIPDIEFDKTTGCAFEKEMLGLYVSDHPLLGVEAALRRKVDCGVAEAAEREDGSVVTLGGVVTGLTRKFTKRGDPMAVFQLEDLQSSIEVTVFPEDDARARPQARRRRHRHGQGPHRQARRARVGFMAMDVNIVEGLDSNSAALHLKVPSTSLNELKIHQIRKILRDHPGASPVFLHIGHGKILRLADEFCVDLDRAVGELRMLLGHDAVML